MNNIETMSPSAILEQWDREYDIENFLNEDYDCVLTEGVIQTIIDGLVKAVGVIIGKIKDLIDKITGKNKNEKNENVRKINDKAVKNLKKDIDNAVKLQDEAKSLNKETDPEEVKKKARKIKHEINNFSTEVEVEAFLTETTLKFVQYIGDGGLSTINTMWDFSTIGSQLLKSKQVSNQVEKYNESGKVPNLQVFVYIYPSDENPVVTVEENNKEYKVHELIPSVEKDTIYAGILDGTEDNLKVIAYKKFKLNAAKLLEYDKSFDEYFANKKIKATKIETEDDED